jgi:hypothetical protein
MVCSRAETCPPYGDLLAFAQIFVALELLQIRHRSIGDPFSPIHVEQLPFWKVVDSYRVSGVEFSSLM